jgi:hypothetical protein
LKPIDSSRLAGDDRCGVEKNRNVVSELRQVIASEHAQVLDLPPLPLARRVN